MTRSRQHLAAGLTLIVVGLLFLLEQLGVPVMRHLWRAWPLVWIGFGAYKLRRHRQGLPSRLAAPERLLLALIAIPGLAVISMHGEIDPARRGELPTPPPLGPERELSQKTGDLALGALLVIHAEGVDIEVQPGADQGRRVNATLSARGDDTDLDPGRVELAQQDDRLQISVHGIASEPGRIRPTLRVAAPPGARIDAKVDNGGLRVTGMSELKVEGRNARIEIAGASGVTEIDAEFGSLRVVGGDSGLNARTHNTDVDIAGMEGDVQLEASDARVALSAVQGRVRVKAPRSNVTLNALQGDVDIETSESAVAGSMFAGALKIRGHSSGIDIRRVEGHADIQSSGRRVRVEGAGTSITARVEDGELVLLGAHGPAELATERGNLRIEQVHGTARARVTDGDVWAQLVANQELHLETDRGDVTLEMGSVPANLELESRGGRIVKGPLHELDVRGRDGSAVLSGARHYGGAAVTVSAREGSIRLVE